MKNSILIVGLCAGLVACGGGSSSSSNTKTGVFLDSPVINIGYRTETLEGVTNSLGEYNYIEGETVTFFIGGLELPPVTAAGTVTPLDLAGSDDTSDSTVVNIIRLLQSLDEDGNPDNGITITAAAKSVATQVDFELSIIDFASSSAVTTLVANSGSTNTVLISQYDAIAHFEDTLVDAGESFVANSNITGIWTTALTDNELLAFVFFADGTYVHMEVDEVAPFDAVGEQSGMEWGTYTRNNTTGELTVTQTFDGNGTTGLTDYVGQTNLFAQVSGDVLTLQFDDNQNGTIDAGESLEFSRSASSNLLGVWTTALTDNELLAFVFFADGTYVHMEVDEVAPFDAVGEQSGMEWGTYTRNNTTGELTVTQTFDGNGTTGLTDYVGQTNLFAQVSGDVLTLQFDDNQNGTIDAGESLEFQRQLEDTFSIDLTQKTASSVITFSSCPSAPLGWNYTFTATSMTLTGSDSWQTPACTTGAEESIPVNNMTTLASDFDIPFNCAEYPICKSADFNKVLSGVDQDARNFTSTYTFNRKTNVLTYVKSVEGTTYTEVVTIQ